MVYLSRIYTKTGDSGQTSLGDGSRVAKDDLRVATYGTVDELNSVLGMLLAQDPHFSELDLLRKIQNDLFDLGADLCFPSVPEEKPGDRLRMNELQVAQLEQVIDRLNAALKPLTSFVLPGGTITAAWCHLARTVCRRAERELVALMRFEAINPQVLVYLNRLSDLLFVLARVCNEQGTKDVLWQPGKNQATS